MKSAIGGDVERTLRTARAAHLATHTLALNAEGVHELSIFDDVPADAKEALLASERTVLEKRAVGALVGLAVADSLGHNFEFIPACDNPGGPVSYNGVPGQGPRMVYPSAEHPGGEVVLPLNRFALKPGQWTDDASMSLCLADSLLLCGGYDGAHVRTLFWHWWTHGLNNAFRLDAGRNDSVGLGGNIAASLRELRFAPTTASVPARVSARGEDAGNGSLMRLAPVPLFFHASPEEARAFAYESSLSTHPGPAAAEACAFLSSLIVAALHRPAEDATPAPAFLEAFIAAYRADVAAQPTSRGSEDARAMLHRLLDASEADTSTERCWNWRGADLGVERTLHNRGQWYNGFPVSSGYFGSYSMDALAMALHCFFHTSSFNAAIVKCINFRGDADTTGAITAQLCGAFYGVDAIEPVWREHLHRWDERQIELRALCLVHARELDLPGLAVRPEPTVHPMASTPGGLADVV